ncbi:LOW QUALITY PROTEIN: membrane-spanning 4-domains subfamily A member 14 [Castor canadensis]|uniref:LOW QUALITY PROTEIN: membrane-spanning 4-domains subfamily A member 14 n=1 Tax=Castor canadensis TaxID=51338 RepID=A0AC58LRQ7_CASCN
MESPSQEKRGTNVITIEPNETILAAFPFRPHISLLDFLKGEPKVLGAVHILLSLVIIGLGIIFAFNSITFSKTFPLVFLTGYPFWGALIFFLTGFLTLNNRKSNKILGLRVTTMNVISALAALAGIIFTIISFTQQHKFCEMPSLEGSCVVGRTLLVGILSVILIISIAELSISVTVASFRSNCWTHSDKVLFFLPSDITQSSEQQSPEENAQLQFAFQENPYFDNTTSNIQTIFFGGYAFFKLRVSRGPLSPQSKSQPSDKAHDSYYTPLIPIPDEHQDSIPPPFKLSQEEEMKSPPSTLEASSSKNPIFTQGNSTTEQLDDKELKSATAQPSEMQTQLLQDQASPLQAVPNSYERKLLALLPNDVISYAPLIRTLLTQALQSEPPSSHFEQLYDLTSEDLPSQDIPSQDKLSQDIPIEDSPSQDIPSQEIPIENISSKDISSKNISSQDMTSQETPTKDILSQDTPSQNTLFQDTPSHNTPSQHIPMQDISSSNTTLQDTLSQHIPMQDIPSQNIPLQDTPPQDISTQDVLSPKTPSQDIPAQDISSQDKPSQDITTQDIPSQDTPSQNTPSQDASYQYMPLQNTSSKDVPCQDLQSQSQEFPEIIYQDIQSEVMELTQEWKSEKKPHGLKSPRRLSLDLQNKDGKSPRRHSLDLPRKHKQSQKRYSLDLPSKSPRRNSLDKKLKAWLFPKKHSIDKQTQYNQSSKQLPDQQAEDQEDKGEQSENDQYEDQEAIEEQSPKAQSEGGEDKDQQANNEQSPKKQIHDQQAADQQAEEEKPQRDNSPNWQVKQQQTQVQKAPKQLSDRQEYQNYQSPEKLHWTTSSRQPFCHQFQDWRSQGWRNRDWKAQEWQFETQHSLNWESQDLLEKEALKQKDLYQQAQIQSTTAQQNLGWSSQNILFQVSEYQDKVQHNTESRVVREEDAYIETGDRKGDDMKYRDQKTTEDMRPNCHPSSSQNLVQDMYLTCLTNTDSEQEIQQNPSGFEILDGNSSSCPAKGQHQSEDSD